MKATSLYISLVIMVFVIAGYYCAENPKGTLGEPLGKTGYFVTYPGQIVVMGLKGNVHASFGDWRDPVIKIGVSCIVWLLLLLPAAQFLSRPRKDHP